MNELKQCYDCSGYTDDAKFVPEFEDDVTGDAWGYMICLRCRFDNVVFNRRAIMNEDARVRLGGEKGGE